MKTLKYISTSILKGVSLYALLIFMGVVLGGCGMTNDEIVSESKKCKDAGLTPVAFQHYWSADIVKVTCIPKQ